MADHERIQTHCRYCYKLIERDTLEQALAAVAEHEAEKHPPRPAPQMADFWPEA